MNDTTAREALEAATTHTHDAAASEAVAALRLIAECVADIPGAHKIKLEWSDQGDWLTYTAVFTADGVRIDEDALSDVVDDLDWATSCLYGSPNHWQQYAVEDELTYNTWNHREVQYWTFAPSDVLARIDNA